MAELNGRPVTAEALTSLALTNYGHFTSMRVDHKRVRGLGLHLERLARDCRTVFGAELDLDQIRRFVRQATNDLTGSFVARVTIFDPALDMAAPAKADAPHVLVTVRPAAALPLPPLRVQPVRYERDAPAIKHLGLFGLLHARRTAQLNGYDDALYIGADGQVTEGGTWNVGFVARDGTVVWPKADVLPGVTMELLQQQEESVTLPISLAEAQEMAAAFATNTTIGVRPLSCIGEVTMAAGHPVLTQLREAYFAVPGESI